MRKFLIILILSLVSCGFGFFGFDEHYRTGSDGGYGGEADTYYIRADGTAEKAVATDPDAANSSMSVATHNAATFAAGDTIRISDQGGVIRATLIPPTDGAEGNVITYEKVPDESPIISTADINTSWALQSQEVGYAVYRGGSDSDGDIFDGAVDDGATERNPHDAYAMTTWANYGVDREFSGGATDSGTGYYYIRTDGEAQDPGSVEIGTRINAINIADKDYITVSGIEFHGPNGRPSNAGVIKDNGLIGIRTGSTYIIIDDCTLKYGVGLGIRLYDTTTANITISNCTIDQCWGGIYGHLSEDMDHNVLITGCTITNTNATLDGLGDHDPIGLYRVRGATVTRNHILGSGYTGMADVGAGPAIVFAGGWDIEASYNLVKGVIGGGISWGLGDNTVEKTANNILIMGNTIVDWAKYPQDADGENHSGIIISDFKHIAPHADLRNTINGLQIINNTLFTANDPGAVTDYDHSGIYVNTTNSDQTSYIIANNITNNLDNMEYEFWINGGTYAQTIIKNNYFFQSGDQINAWGTPRTFTELNDLHANFDANAATDPELDENYHLGVDLTGIDLGDTYDDGLDENTTWSPLSVVTADWDTYGWNPGAFVYGTD